ncbi:MAG: cyclic nucleotide-binding domain-containing protein [Thermoanaerobaculia bacterium]
MSTPDRSHVSSASPEVVRDIAGGEFIFRQGELGTDMFVIHEGRVEIVRTMAGEERQVAVLEKGDFFGEMSLLEELPRNASARALTDSKLLEISRPLFARMLKDNPEIGVRIMRKLSRRVRRLDELLDAALQEGQRTREQVEEGLVAAPVESGPPIPATLHHEESGVVFDIDLATSVGVGRRDPVTRIQPGIDLTPLDPDRTSSRRHARIYRQDGTVWVVEEIGTLNGTFVNGNRLETAVPAPVESDDRVRFGLVEFVFRLTGQHDAAP